MVTGNEEKAFEERMGEAWGNRTKRLFFRRFAVKIKNGKSKLFVEVWRKGIFYFAGNDEKIQRVYSPKETGVFTKKKKVK